MNNDMIGALDRQKDLLSSALQADDEFRDLVAAAPQFCMLSTIQMLDIIPEQHRGSPASIVSFLVKDYLRLRGYRLAGVSSEGLERWIPNAFSGSGKELKAPLRLLPLHGELEELAVHSITDGIGTVRKLASALNCSTEEVKHVVASLLEQGRIKREGKGYFVRYTAAGRMDSRSNKSMDAAPVIVRPVPSANAVAVLAAVKSGNNQTGTIVKATGLPVNTVRNILATLTGQGQLERQGEGQETHYVVTGEPQ